MATPSGPTRGGGNRKAPSSRTRTTDPQKPRTRAPSTRATHQRPSTRAGSNQRKPANNAGGPPTLTRAHVNGFFVGAIVGIFVGVGGYAYLTNPSNTERAVAVDSAPDETPVEDTGPRFDFFTVLPNQQLDLGAGVEPAELPNSQQSRSTYVLQAGSFRAADDADRRRGELALLGLEAKVEETRGENGRWYRVSIGPFESRSAMAKARSLTAQASIDTLLLKRSAGE